MQGLCCRETRVQPFSSCVEGHASTTAGMVFSSGDWVSEHRVRDGEQLAHNRGEHPLSGLAAPAQMGAGIADGRTVARGVHDGHAGKHAHGGATTPGAALVPTAVPVQGDTPTRAAISRPLRRLTSDNLDMSTAATTGFIQGTLRSRSARDRQVAWFCCPLYCPSPAANRNGRASVSGCPTGGSVGLFRAQQPGLIGVCP